MINVNFYMVIFMIFQEEHHDFHRLCYLIKFENRALRYNYLHFGMNEGSVDFDGMQNNFIVGEN